MSCNTLGNLFRAIIVGAVVVALTMQFMVTFSCDFIETETDVSFGIWFYDDGNGECVEWENHDEGVVTGARTALTIATIAGICAGGMVAIEWIFCQIGCAGCLEGSAFVVAWLAGACVNMILAIEDCGENAEDWENGDCKWGTAATYMVIANICYFGCAILLCCTPEPEPICKQISDSNK